MDELLEYYAEHEPTVVNIQGQAENILFFCSRSLLVLALGVQV